MAQYVLHAFCEGTAPKVDTLRHTSLSEITHPDNLPVFIGDKKNTELGSLSVNTASSGLYTRQRFQWRNWQDINEKMIQKYFFMFKKATVTLEVELKAQNSTVGYTNAASPNVNLEIPRGALAVNLGNKGWQFDASNLPNGDEWGKLVYYDQGGLGIGWAFDTSAYFARGDGSTLGLYMLGGLIPDLSYNDFINATGNTTVFNQIKPFNVQIGRDQALITSIVQTDLVRGPQGYWNVSMEPFQSPALAGRDAGNFFLGPSTGMSSKFTPSMAWPVGYPSVIIPSSFGPTSMKHGWSLRCPSYAPSTHDGSMPAGNCLSIAPGAFMTTEGLSILTEPTSDKETDLNKKWTNYWQSASSVVTLRETQPFSIESPLFSAPICMEYIPYIKSGIYCLVPITRVCNGVYFYVPEVRDSVTEGTKAVEMRSNIKASSTHYRTGSLGFLSQWFSVSKVTLTLNLPFVRIDTPIQASRFFSTATYQASLAMKVPFWTKFLFNPTDRIGADPYQRTLKINEILPHIFNGSLYFEFTARSILTKIRDAFAAHGLVTQSTWGLKELQIVQIRVSCTTALDVLRLFRYQLNLPTFTSSIQGAFLNNGGIKVFSRQGPWLSAGPPDNLYVAFQGVQNPDIGIIDPETNERVLLIHQIPQAQTTPGALRNDYHSGFDSFLFTENVSIKMPDEYSMTDPGGKVKLGFRPRPTMLIPFSGILPTNDNNGGPQLEESQLQWTSGQPYYLTSTVISQSTAGWFNKLNPFSPDYDQNYDVNTSGNTFDTKPFLDYKMVDLMARKVEIWIQVLVPMMIYSNNPFT